MIKHLYLTCQKKISDTLELYLQTEPLGCWKPNPGLTQEQSVLTTAEPILQAPYGSLFIGQHTLEGSAPASQARRCRTALWGL